MRVRILTRLKMWLPKTHKALVLGCGSSPGCSAPVHHCSLPPLASGSPDPGAVAMTTEMKVKSSGNTVN